MGTVRGELGRARALAAGVKKKPEVAKAPVTGNFVLEQTQASKELLVKQRKEWMAAVKRTQDSTVKFVAQKRVAANSNGYTSEAQERAHLIRMAQDHNWMDYVKAEEPKERPDAIKPL
ncbi:unnamed protein product [Effrenium voratum]|nr:unnamed protein product [Effrenium voratum]